jgi:hypothetical protein
MVDANYEADIALCNVNKLPLQIQKSGQTQLTTREKYKIYYVALLFQKTAFNNLQIASWTKNDHQNKLAHFKFLYRCINQRPYTESRANVNERNLFHFSICCWILKGIASQRTRPANTKRTSFATDVQRWSFLWMLNVSREFCQFELRIIKTIGRRFEIEMWALLCARQATTFASYKNIR